MADHKYSDFRTNMDIHPVKRDITLITDTASIGQSIKNLVLTGRYERFFHPLKGAGIPQTLFENFSMDTEVMLDTRIRDTIRKYEPRAIVRDVDIRINEDHNAYEVTIFYSPINTHDTLSVDVILKRVR